MIVDAIFEVGGTRYITRGRIPYHRKPLLSEDRWRISLKKLARLAIWRTQSKQLDEDYFVTVLDAKNIILPISEDWLKAGKPAFRSGFIFANVTNLAMEDVEYTLAARNYLANLETRWIDVTDMELAPGPYLYMNGALWMADVLENDTQRAFVTPISPIVWSDGSFEPLKASGGPHQCLNIAVPYAIDSPNVERPLRIAIKDCYELQGVKNTLCNRSFFDTMPPSRYTSMVVNRFVRDGAQVLGLTKLSTLIGREEPMDAVDFQTPFNPRGDGYQSPAGSSSGSAVAVASYKWLDCAIGTDTTGSGKRPALANGVWQFRISHHDIYLRNMVTTYERFDAPCLFARDLPILSRAVRILLDVPERAESSEPDQPSYGPYSIIYPLEYLPVDNEQQMKLIDNFVGDMETALAATVRRVSIKELWRTNHPSGTCEDLDEYLHEVVTRTFYYAYYHSFSSFRQSYQEMNDGRPPYVIPFVRRRWEKGAAVKGSEHKEAENRMEVYSKWLLDNLVHVDGKEALIVLPVATVAPNYRDEPSPSPENQSALDQLFLSPILRAPDISIPIGEVSYHSKITNEKEYLPVVVNVVGAPGTDLGLLGAIKKVMKDSGRSDCISTGKRMFSGLEKTLGS